MRRNAEIDSLYPVGDESDERQTPTLHDALSKKKSHGSGSKKCLFLSKNMDEIEEAFA